jgi:hypothetical protein
MKGPAATEKGETMTHYMGYGEAFRWLVSQEGVIMSDTRARTIMSFARDAGRAPASDTHWLEYLYGAEVGGEGGYSVRRDPVGIRKSQERARGRGTTS